MRLERLEDARLLVGRGRFADDFDRPGQVWARFVRSSVAAGRIEAVDLAQARTMPGVVAAASGADVAHLGAIPIRVPRGDEPPGCLQPPLARSSVRYVGEPVAVVVADDPYRAEDAAEAVDVRIEAEAPTLDARAAEPALVVEAHWGDVDHAFATASHVVEVTVEVGRHGAVPLEPRSLLAELDRATGRLELTGITKVPVFDVEVIARALGLPRRSVHARAVDAGGGFGARGELYPEDLVVSWLALTLGVPVKWTEDRAESLVALNHSRQQHHHIRLALDRDGRILGLDDDIVHDNGAYLRTHGAMVPELTVTMLPGPYRVPAYRGRCRVVLTNKTPCGTYRAPGRYEGTFAREQALDVAADQLGLDRIELRRRNLLRADELPLDRGIVALGTPVVLDPADYHRLFDWAVRATTSWRAEAARSRGSNAAVRLGVGLACFLEKSGLGPSETAEVIVDSDGAVRVHSGGTSFGQGVETVMAELVAAELGVEREQVIVVAGDTDLQPFGIGSWASRTTVVGGSAAHLAAKAVAAKARRVGARLLEVDPEDLELAEGSLRVRGTPARRVALGELAKRCATEPRLLDDDEDPGLSARRRFSVDHMTYPFGVHAALVSVDVETGAIEVLRYLVAFEVGRAVRADLVVDQLRGGVVQGLGGALSEEFRYDAAGQPLATTLTDYLLPVATGAPATVETFVSERAPSASNPLGAKGAGEGGITAVGAAIAGAARDALGLSGSVGALPITPERCRALADEAAKRPSTTARSATSVDRLSSSMEGDPVDR